MCGILLWPMNAYAADDFDWFEEEIMEEELEYAGAVYAEGEFLNGDLMRISVFSEDFSTPVLGLAFHLDYENEKVSFLKYEPGDFLEMGGDPFYLVNDDGIGSKLIFGSTLRKDDDFPLGGDKVVDFYFQIEEGESFNFNFEKGVVSTLDIVRQDLDKIQWRDLLFERDYTKNATDLQANIVEVEGNSYATIILIMISSIIFSLALIFIIKKMKVKSLACKSVNFK